MVFVWSCSVLQLDNWLCTHFGSTQEECKQMSENKQTEIEVAMIGISFNAILLGYSVLDHQILKESVRASLDGVLA